MQDDKASDKPRCGSSTSKQLQPQDRCNILAVQSSHLKTRSAKVTLPTIQWQHQFEKDLFGEEYIKLKTDPK